MKNLFIFFFVLFTSLTSYSQSYKAYIKDIENGNYTQLDDDRDIFIQKNGSGDILQGRIKKVEADRLIVSLENNITDTFAFDSISQIGIEKNQMGGIINGVLNVILVGSGVIVGVYGFTITFVGLIYSAYGAGPLIILGAAIAASGLYMIYKGVQGLRKQEKQIKYTKLIPGKVKLISRAIR